MSSSSSSSSYSSTSLSLSTSSPSSASWSSFSLSSSATSWSSSLQRHHHHYRHRDVVIVIHIYLIFSHILVGIKKSILYIPSRLQMPNRALEQARSFHRPVLAYISTQSSPPASLGSPDQHPMVWQEWNGGNWIVNFLLFDYKITVRAI